MYRLDVYVDESGGRDCYEVWGRYRHFCRLRETLAADFSGLPALPGKSLIVRTSGNTAKELERGRALADWMGALLLARPRQLLAHRPVREFLGHSSCAARDAQGQASPIDSSLWHEEQLLASLQLYMQQNKHQPESYAYQEDE